MLIQSLFTTIALLGSLAGSGKLVWQESGMLPAGRVHFTPGWSAGPFFYLMDHDSRNGWVSRQLRGGKLSQWARVKNIGFTRSKWSNPVIAVGPRVYAFGHWGEARVSILSPASGRLSAWKNAMEERGMGGGKEPLLWGGGAYARVGRRQVLYHVGGFEYEGANFTNPRSQNKVFYATLLPKGGVTNWLQTTPLPYHPMGAAAVFADGFLYVLGGCAGRFGAGDPWTGMVDVVVRAPVKRDGTLGSWTRLGRRMPYRACGVAAFVRRGFLYVAGGELQGDGAGDAKRFTDRFARAEILDGELGAWEELPSLPGVVGKTPHGFIGDWFYIVGLSKGDRTPVYGVRIDP